MDEIKNTNEENETTVEIKQETVQKTLHIEGMMCEHCENRVKKALEKLDGVSLAEASHEKKQAIVTLTGQVSDEDLKAAVEAADYQVTEIQ